MEGKKEGDGTVTGEGRELVGGGLPTQCGYLQNNNEETENMKGDFYI